MKKIQTDSLVSDIHIKKSCFLKVHRQISKKRCFEKYCSCDQACQVSAL